jgi:hypothetical protein
VSTKFLAASGINGGATLLHARKGGDVRGKRKWFTEEYALENADTHHHLVLDRHHGVPGVIARKFSVSQK